MPNERVIVKLIGGLGNQMFQYATALSFSMKKSAELLIDKSSFESYKLHNFSLSNLAISASFANEKQIKEIKKRNLFFKRTNVFKENGLNYNKSLFEADVPIYLDGYFQSEKYFKDVRKKVIEEFQPSNELSNYSNEITSKIKNSEISISLHIRRGDYLYAKTAQVHGLCSLDYYNKAVEYIKNKNPEKQLSFFIFSDDHDWVSENLKLDGEVIQVNGNGVDRNFEDIILMSKCEHNIIANSSFSWWGSWLNENEDKLVIAPREWFKTKDLNSEDIYCSNWIKI